MSPRYGFGPLVSSARKRRRSSENMRDAADALTLLAAQPGLAPTQSTTLTVNKEPQHAGHPTIHKLVQAPRYRSISRHDRALSSGSSSPLSPVTTDETPSSLSSASLGRSEPSDTTEDDPLVRQYVSPPPSLPRPIQGPTSQEGLPLPLQHFTQCIPTRPVPKATVPHAVPQPSGLEPWRATLRPSFQTSPVAPNSAVVPAQYAPLLDELAKSGEIRPPELFVTVHHTKKEEVDGKYGYISVQNHCEEHKSDDEIPACLAAHGEQKDWIVYGHETLQGARAYKKHSASLHSRIYQISIDDSAFELVSARQFEWASGIAGGNQTRHAEWLIFRRIPMASVKRSRSLWEINQELDFRQATTDLIDSCFKAVLASVRDGVLFQAYQSLGDIPDKLNNVVRADLAKVSAGHVDEVNYLYARLSTDALTRCRMIPGRLRSDWSWSCPEDDPEVAGNIDLIWDRIAIALEKMDVFNEKHLVDLMMPTAQA